MNFPGKNTEVDGYPLGYLPNPGFELSSPALAGGFFTTEPPGKALFHPKKNPKVYFIYFYKYYSENIAECKEDCIKIIPFRLYLFGNLLTKIQGDTNVVRSLNSTKMIKLKNENLSHQSFFPKSITVAISVCLFR